MKRREVLFLVLMVYALQANAQTEQDDKGILSGNDATLQTMGFVNHLMIDSAKYAIDAMKPNLLPAPWRLAFAMLAGETWDEGSFGYHLPPKRGTSTP